MNTETPAHKTDRDSVARYKGNFGLDQMLDRAGAVLGFKARLQLTGLVTTSDIDLAEADLEAGSRPLTDLIGIHA